VVGAGRDDDEVFADVFLDCFDHDRVGGEGGDVLRLKARDDRALGIEADEPFFTLFGRYGVRYFDANTAGEIYE